MFLDDPRLSDAIKAKCLEAVRAEQKKIEEYYLEQLIKLENQPTCEKPEGVKENLVLPEVDEQEVLRAFEEMYNNQISKMIELFEDTAIDGINNFDIQVSTESYVDLKNGKSVRYPGPLDTLNPQDIEKFKKSKKWAASEYEKIKSDPNDVERIAHNTGIPLKIIEQIKNHLFYEKYYLDTGYKTLDPDNEQVAAWYRLRGGDYIKNDIRFLLHEYAESELLKGPAKKIVRIAHEILNNNGLRWFSPDYREK